jgi:hypothetical protein
MHIPPQNPFSWNKGVYFTRANTVNQWLFFITIPISTLFGKSTKQFMIRIGLMVLLLDVIYNLLVKCDREIIVIIHHILHQLQ